MGKLEIEILEKGGNHIRFVLSEANAAFANALRRIMISEVPSMAIEDVFFYENQTALSDEFIAHRLGLMPLKTDLDGYNLPSDCECKSEIGCNKCRVTGSLEAEAKDAPLTVYSGDIKFEDPDIAPVSDRIPIIKLTPGQKLKFEVHARLGTGKQHAKWQPVSACAYKQHEKRADAFQFYVESTGCLPPERIVLEAAKILESKAERFVAEVRAARRQE